MMDMNTDSPANKIIMRRIIAANLPKHPFVDIIYSDIGEEGGALGFQVGSHVKQIHVPKTMSHALLHGKKNEALDNLFRL